MLKTIFVSVSLFFASILLVANVAWSSPLLHGTFIVAETSVTPVPSSESATPQASESSKTTLTKSSKDGKDEAVKDQNQKTPTLSKSEKTKAESGGPYDMESIKAFNRSLYGS